MPTQNDPRRVDRAEEIDARCIVKFRPNDDWIGEYGFDWFREGDHKEFPNYISDYKQDNLVGKYGANISGYEKEANGRYRHIQNSFRNFSGRCLYYWEANNDDYYCMFGNNKIGHFVWNNNVGFHLEDQSGNSIFTYKIQLKKIPKNAQIQNKKPIAYFSFQNQQGNLFLVPKDHTTQLPNYPAYYYPGDNNTGAYYYSQIYGNEYCSVVFDNQSVCHLEDWAGNIYVCESILRPVPKANINGASIAYFTLEGQLGNQYMVQKDSFGWVLKFFRVFRIENRYGLFVQDENEEKQSRYHLEDLSGNIYDINLQNTNQTGLSKVLFRCEYQQGGPVMIQDNGPWSFNVKDDQRNFFWNTSTIRQYPLDPDFNVWLGINLTFAQSDEANRPCDADVFAKGQYSPIPIKNRNQKYYVPTISLFYENSTRAKNGRWGKSEAEVKMLISGENIDTDLKRITFEFECTPGIKLSHKTIKGSSITKTAGYYVQPITIRLTKEFSVFSLNEGDGMINVYAKFSNGDRFLAGRLCVAKCIPKSVNIVFVKIPVQLNANDAIIHFGSNVAPNVAIDGECDYLKQFLSQAHVVPNIEVRTFTKAEKKQDLQTVINDHKQIVTRRNSMGQEYQVAVALDPDQNYPLGKCLEELFNQDSPEYKDYYKIFLIGARGRIQFDNNNAEMGCLLGQSSGNPSNSAVIFELGKSYPKKISQFEHYNAATLTHELLHCFGLWHSFSNFRPENLPYTLEKFKTSNIMDYQKDISLITLWKWQWEMIRAATGMQDIDTNLDVHPGFFRRLLSHLWFK